MEDTTAKRRFLFLVALPAHQRCADQAVNDDPQVACGGCGLSKGGILGREGLPGTDV